MSSFAEFKLLPSIGTTLTEKKLFRPTEIQFRTIPILMNKKSVVGISETGSGKTLAYALPLLHLLKTLENAKDPVRNESAPRALVMVPTSELGEQVSKVFKTFAHDTRVRIRPILGAMEFEHARRNVAAIFEVLIATPGRLVQLIEKKLINLNDVRILIFDEADQMLDQGFLNDSNLIVDQCPSDVQLGLFSATVSNSVQELMNTLFSKAEVIRSSGSGKVVKSLITKNLIVEDGKRWPLFEKILAQKVEGGTLVFTNTREQCDKVATELTAKGFPCSVYRGEMDKKERRQNLKLFRDGKTKILVSTDLAGRGLDVENIARVINFHLPKQHENYLHRVGRTARAGREGLVINLVTERDQRLMDRLAGKKSSAPASKLSERGRTKDSDKSTDKRDTKSAGKTAAKSVGKSDSRSASKLVSRTPGKNTGKDFDSKATKFGKKEDHKSSGKSSDKSRSKDSSQYSSSRGAGRTDDREAGSRVSRDGGRGAGRVEDRESGRETGRETGRVAGRVAGRKAVRKIDHDVTKTSRTGAANASEKRAPKASEKTSASQKSSITKTIKERAPKEFSSKEAKPKEIKPKGKGVAKALRNAKAKGRVF